MIEKPHKFFERYLNNDLDQLSKDLQERYRRIEKEKTTTKDDAWLSSNSISTIKWRDYNVFQFHIDGLYEIYSSISDMAKEACEYYNIDFKEQRYMVQGWFNINYNKKGKLTWHDHGPKGAPLFHGYYCVNAEPSITYYKVNNEKVVENINKNNRIIMSEMQHPHAMGDWDWEGPRITVAYDLLPLKELQSVYSNTEETRLEDEQHWIPLL